MINHNNNSISNNKQSALFPLCANLTRNCGQSCLGSLDRAVSCVHSYLGPNVWTERSHVGQVIWTEFSEVWAELSCGPRCLGSLDQAVSCVSSYLDWVLGSLDRAVSCRPRCLGWAAAEFSEIWAELSPVSRIGLLCLWAELSGMRCLEFHLKDK